MFNWEILTTETDVSLFVLLNCKSTGSCISLLLIKANHLPLPPSPAPCNIFRTIFSTEQKLISALHPTSPVRQQTSRPPECWSNGALLGIVTEFQTVIPYTSCYWNRKKHLCCKSLRSNVLLAKNETPHKKPKCLLIRFNILWVLQSILFDEPEAGSEMWQAIGPQNPIHHTALKFGANSRYARVKGGWMLSLQIIIFVWGSH